jgi:tetratricopeptide (TPR) repeat protein
VVGFVESEPNPTTLDRAFDENFIRVEYRHPPFQRMVNWMVSQHGQILVSRQQEMAEIGSALDDAMSGRGRLIMLAGEPGIGKTRMAQELAANADVLGGQVLWGRCHEGTGRPPYWLWVQLIRSYVRNCDTERLNADLGSGASIIAEVVPEVGEKLSGLLLPLGLEPEQARFRLFDSVTAFLKRAATERPLVLILEDLQWADTPCLLMLEFLSAELLDTPLLLLGTYRDAELPRNDALSNTLGELARQQHFREFLLQSLPHEDVTQFMAGEANAEPSQELARKVFLTTEGDSLFMTQIVQLLVRRGQINPTSPETRPVDDVEIPRSVRLAIRRRLSRLSEDSLEILKVAAVIGREFSLDQLAALTEIATEERLLVVLEEALTDRVIEELPRSVGRYQFSHSLIQDTLAQELSPTRRVHLHARIAQDLEILYGDNIEIHAAELAYHYAESQGATGLGKMVNYSSLAGEWALSAYAYDDALAHFKRALTGREGQAMDGDTAKHLFGLARAQGATGQVDEAWGNMEHAFDYFIRVGDVSGAVAVSEYPLFYVPGLKDATRMVTEALALVPGGSLESRRLLSRLGLLLNLDNGDYQQATEVFNRALTSSRKEGDAALEMRTEAAGADADFYHLNWVAALEKSERVITLAQRRNDLQSEAWPRWLAS